MPINDADREAANALRAVLADICGFWHKGDDDSPLCLALARHREEAETRLANKLVPSHMAAVSHSEGFDFGRRQPVMRAPNSVPSCYLVARRGD